MGGAGKWYMRLIDPLGVMPYTPGKTLYNKDKPWSPTAKTDRNTMTDALEIPQVAAPEEDQIKPGQKVATLATSSQGLLTTPSVGRSTLLGY